MSKDTPSKLLAEKIEQKKQQRSGLSTEEAYRLVKAEDPDLIKKFSREIGFNADISSEENWVPVK